MTSYWLYCVYYLLKEYMNHSCFVQDGMTCISRCVEWYVGWCRWKTGCSSWRYSEEQWWSSGKMDGNIFSSVSHNLLSFCLFCVTFVAFP